MHFTNESSFLSIAYSKSVIYSSNLIYNILFKELQIIGYYKEKIIGNIDAIVVHKKFYWTQSSEKPYVKTKISI